MILNLSEHSSEPLHSQATRQIRGQILSGALPSGSSLPSIRELARATRVSVITIQRAYNDLELEGFIEARRSKGFFVTDLSSAQKEAAALNRLHDTLEPIVEEAFAQGLKHAQIESTLREVLAEKEAAK